MSGLDVEIWSDIACPFCLVGKRNFEVALRSFEQSAEVSVTWRSFELDPGAPAAYEGDVWDNIARAYNIARDEAISINMRTQRLFAETGIEARFDLVCPGNMFDGHRLIHFARSRGRQDAMKERLLRAYFAEGELIADHDALVRLGEEVGLDAGEVTQMLATDAFAEDVRSDVATARRLGITSVPHFVVDRSFGLAGAQPPEVFLSLLKRAWNERPPLPESAGGEACGVTGC
ncbi:DsbA family oxidoreductase [Pseudochelatococcus sp. B33]